MYKTLCFFMGDADLVVRKQDFLMEHQLWVAGQGT